MKKSFIPLILIVILFSKYTMGQETNQKLEKDWSIALTFAPLTTFYYYHSPEDGYFDHYSIGITEVIYPFGANLIVDRKLNNRISISSGASFKTKTNVNLGEGADMLYYETSTENKYVFEIPITLKYHFPVSSRFFSPYLNAGIRNTYFKRSYIGEYIEYTSSPWGTTGEIDKHEGKYFLFANLGLGFNFNIIKSFSLILESNLTYSISGFGYLEGQGGIRYSFK